ncbi:antirestriction protein ArdA [Algiphilus sp. W345]|uniref:Antirestriction protein ArdA n=1 Tax=Banduia mediterranea TaxID=3075609 RepID=A0ABU2WMT5_9GAMM|nr:antirestriction protein ArdA [Algiphilus sp. W345]MDT0499185.1 antirestriction protein ArdA [Algiphilus sp. W345]
MTSQAEIRIYVACLAAYNNGILHGAWIDAYQDADAIRDAIAGMLKASPEPDAEEWAIHDYGGFEGLRLSEYEGIDEVADKAAFVAEHGSLGAEMVSYYGGDLEEARKAIDEHYAGEFRSVAEFAAELTVDTTEIPEGLRFYVDYERMARDMEMGGDILAVATAFEEVHIFWRH